MDRIVDVAQCLIEKYRQLTGEDIGELKLQKLLYFCQRESYAVFGSPMFKEKMQGWKHGPVSPAVRASFAGDGMNCATRPVGLDTLYIVNRVLDQYASLASWKLSQLSHEEKSWLRSREGLAPDARGAQLLRDEDIAEDAKKVRPYDSLYDMYYDEFDDAESVAAQ